jgi:hypothetical protein
MANPGEPEGIAAGADQGANLPDMMPRDPDATADRRGQPSTAEGAFGAATGSDYGSGAGGGNEQATGGRFGTAGTDSTASSATGSTGTDGESQTNESTGAGLGVRGGAGWGGSGGGASPSVGALSGSNAHGVGDGTVGSNTDATGGTLGTFGGTDRAGDTATESFSGPTAPEPDQSTMPQRPTRSSQVDAADQNQYGGDISQVAPEERQNAGQDASQDASQDAGQNMGQGMTGDQGITPDTRPGGI